MKATLGVPEIAGVANEAWNDHAALTAPSHHARLRIKSILVAVDFSMPAMAALDYASALAKKLNAHIHLVHVQSTDEGFALSGAAHRMRVCAESLTSFCERPEAGSEPETHFWPENCHVRMGRACEEICTLARELDVDLIVLARGNTGVKRVLLGSTAERVVRLSPCPVLVVRKCRRRLRLGPLATPVSFRIRTILAPVDFSHCSIGSAMYAAFLAKAFKAKLCLFHAFQAPPATPDHLGVASVERERAMVKAEHEIERFAKQEFLRDVDCCFERRIGPSKQEICRQTQGADLVVIATHGRSGVNRLLIGSVAEYVVRHARSSLIVLPSRFPES